MQYLLERRLNSKKVNNRFLYIAVMHGENHPRYWSRHIEFSRFWIFLIKNGSQELHVEIFMFLGGQEVEEKVPDIF